MKKKTALVISVLLVIMMIFTACGKPQTKDTASAGAVPSPSVSEDKVVIGQMDGQPVYLKDLAKWYYMASYYGTETGEDNNTILDDYMSYLVEKKELQSKGYMNLTADEVKTAESNASGFLADLEQYFYASEDDVLSQYLQVTKEEFTDYFKLLVAEGKAKKDVVGDKTPTDDQIKAKYDENVASDKESMDSDPTVYISNIYNGTNSYYVPAGVRMVKRILIPMDETMEGAIGALRDGGYNDQAVILRNAGLKDIEATAKEALSAAQSDFNQALTKYGKDSDMSDKGYPVVTGATDMGEEFTSAAMALAKIGDVSGLVASDEGYEILQYTSDKAQGPVSLDEVKEAISADLKDSLEQDAWNNQLTKWKTAHNVTADYSAMPSQEEAPAESPDSEATTQAPDSSPSPTQAPSATVTPSAS